MERLIFDSHAHYDDAAFDGDRDALLADLPAKGVLRAVCVGADLESSERAAALALRWPYLYAAAGIHPESAAEEPPGAMDRLEALLGRPKMVAVGEIGLDYHYEDGAPPETQRDLFARQLALANRRGLPVIVHDRDAHGDTVALLRRFRPAGVVHCFSGSVEMMREVVRLGMYIGLGGSVTFKNARVPVAVAAAVPTDRLLLETDAPYLSPVPFRGRRNDSSRIPHTAARIAEIRGVPAEEILKTAAQNAAALFHISLSDDDFLH